MSAPAVSVVIVSYNTRELTRRCLEAARAAVRDEAGEVWLVDNASGDGTAEMVRGEFPDVRLLANAENVGYGTANNQAMRRAAGRAFLLVNSDAEVTGGALQRLLAALREDPSLGLVGARLVGPDGRPRPSVRRFPGAGVEILARFGIGRLLPRRLRSRWLLGEDARPEDARRPDWVTGACVLVRREAFERTGGFDESIFLYGEELDWCARLARAGWRIGGEHEAVVVHVGRASSGPALGRRRLDLSLEGDLRYLARFRGWAALAAFALARGAGLVLEAAVAGLTWNRGALDLALHQLRAHLRLSVRYLVRGSVDAR